MSKDKNQTKATETPVETTITANAIAAEKARLQDLLNSGAEISENDKELIATFGLKAAKVNFPEAYAIRFAARITKDANGNYVFPTAEEMLAAFHGTKYSETEIKKSYAPAVSEYRRLIARIKELG